MLTQVSAWDLGMNTGRLRSSPIQGRPGGEDGIRHGVKEFGVIARLSPARAETTSQEECLSQESRAAASLPITFAKNSPALRKQRKGLPAKTREADKLSNLK